MGLGLGLGLGPRLIGDPVMMILAGRSVPGLRAKTLVSRVMSRMELTLGWIQIFEHARDNECDHGTLEGMLSQCDSRSFHRRPDRVALCPGVSNKCGPYVSFTLVSYMAFYKGILSDI